MKKIAIIIFSLMASNAVLASGITTNWNDKYQKSITLTCGEDNYSYTCSQVCGNESKCEIEEKTCYNCLGSSVYLTHLFKQMGQTYRSTNEETDAYGFVDFLLKNEFVTITSKSVYNNVDRFNSSSLRARFQSLCSNNTEYPVVFLESVGKRHDLGKVRYVSCGEEVYRMTDDPDIDFNQKSELY